MKIKFSNKKTKRNKKSNSKDCEIKYCKIQAEKCLDIIEDLLNFSEELEQRYNNKGE